MSCKRSFPPPSNRHGNQQRSLSNTKDYQRMQTSQSITRWSGTATVQGQRNGKHKVLSYPREPMGRCTRSPQREPSPSHSSLFKAMLTAK